MYDESLVSIMNTVYNKKYINIDRILSEGNKILEVQSKSYEYSDGLSY